MNPQLNSNEGNNVNIPLEEVEFSSTIRLFDPNGRVFFWNGEVYRGIYQERIEFINKLFDDGVVEALISDKLLIPTERTNYSLKGFGLVLKHEVLDFYVNSNELSLSFLIDAYKVYLKLYLCLYKKGYTLIDGHTANLASYKDGVPIFIDFGSIIIRDKSSQTGLFESFSCFYYKICLVKKGIPNTFFRKLSGELTRYEYLMLVSPLHRLMHRLISKFENISIFRNIGSLIKKIIYTNNAEYFLSFKGIPRLMRYIVNKSKGDVYSYTELDQVAGIILKKISKIKPRSDKTYWSEYHDGVTLNAGVSKRQQTVIEQVKTITAKGVLDIGANAGIISDLLYPYCDYVLSVDYDEDAVDKNYQRLKKDKLEKRIYPIVKNVVRMNKTERQRYKQDAVIALALTHHLRLGQGHSFDYISKLLSDITAKLLIVEFMPNGLGVNKIEATNLPVDYTLENFIECLEKNFATVENLGIKTEVGASPRNMLVCRK